MQQHLKAAREKKGLTIDALAERSGVHKSTISRLERGETEPLHDTAQRLEAALGLKRGTLRFGAELEAAS